MVRGQRSSATADLTVDVIIDNYNYATYLRDAIDSALAQTYPAVRTIVVDDGSVDGSREIIASYGSRVDAVFKDNGGQASAFNAGFSRSGGDVVIFLDADDRLLPNAAARAVAAFVDDDELVKVQWRMHVIDAEGQRTGAVKPPPHLSMPSGDVRALELASPFDLTWLPTSGNAFRRSALERIMPLPEDGSRILADSDLQHLTPLLGRVRSLNAFASEYRVHGANAYESSDARLDLGRLREAVRAAAGTRLRLERLAGEVGLDVPGGEIISVADVANRLISLRLDRDGHPLRGDSVPGLLVAGIRATKRRRDISIATRLAFAFWFVTETIAPKRTARVLAEWFLFYVRRPTLTRWFARQGLRVSDAAAVDLSLARRIHVLGGPGSGKSTFARQLGQALELPVFELDRVAFEGADFILRPLPQRLLDIRSIAGREAWISEGIFIGWTGELVHNADVVVWLDHVGWRRAVWNIFGRFVRFAITEAKAQPGVRKVSRFTDYKRHLLQLLSALRSTRRYYKSGAELGSDPAPSRAATTVQLSRYGEKVIHLATTDDVDALLCATERSIAMSGSSSADGVSRLDRGGVQHPE